MPSQSLKTFSPHKSNITILQTLWRVNSFLKNHLTEGLPTTVSCLKGFPLVSSMYLDLDRCLTFY